MILPTRDAILDCLGQFPPSVAVHWSAEGREERDGVEYTRIRYDLAPAPPLAQSRGQGTGERVTAWLLRPADEGRAASDGPLPGVLAIHPHAGQYHLGKSETAGLIGNPDWHYGLELARRGYTVLCPDLLGFEDRRPPAEQRAAHSGALEDRSYELWLGKVLAVQGSSLQARYISDLSRALDVLADQPGVDADRLGCIGHSGGGQETLWLAWYDERVKVAVSAGGVSLLSVIIANSINHMMAMWVPRLLTVCDLDGVVAGIAPRACLLTHGESDPIFPLDGVRRIASAAEATYQDRGAPDCFALRIFPVGHLFPPDMREVAYQWLDRWLKASAD